MTIEALTRAEELSYFFMIAGNLAVAKASNNVEALSECIDDLEGMAIHSGVARLRRYAGAAAEQASALLADLQSQRFGYTGRLVVLTRAADPANLN